MFKRNGKNDSLEFCNLPLLNYLICQEASGKCVCVCVCVWRKETSETLRERTSTFSIHVFSLSVMSDSLWHHELQHARLPCPSLSSRVCSNSCPLSQWCHPNISSSVASFSSCSQSFPASGSFPMSQLFTSGSQSSRASVSASVLPMNAQVWFPLGLIGLVSSLYKGLSSLL